MKQKHLLLALAVLSALFITLPAQQLDLDWVRTIAGPDTISSREMEVTPSGDIIVTGTFAGTQDMDPGQMRWSHGQDVRGPLHHIGGERGGAVPRQVQPMASCRPLGPAAGRETHHRAGAGGADLQARKPHFRGQIPGDGLGHGTTAGVPTAFAT